MGTTAVARSAGSKEHAKPDITHKPATTHGSEVRETTNRIYKKYGNDLSAFYQDVKKSIILEKCDNPKPKRHGAAD